MSSSRSRIFSLMTLSVSASLAAMTMPPVLRSMRLHSAGVKAFSHLGFHSRLCLNVVDEGIHLLRLVGVDHHPLGLIRQQQVLILVHHRQVRLEQRQKQIFL